MACAPCFRIGLNAHLLDLSGNYRSAGINWYIFHLLRALSERQRSASPGESDLAFTVFSSELKARQSLPSAEIVLSRLPTHHPIVRIAWEQILQPAALTKSRIDLLHALAFAGPRVISIPWIVTIYDLSFMRYPRSFNALNRLYLKWAVADSLRRADRVIAISKNTRDDLVHSFGVSEEKIQVIYCGKDESFHPTSDVREVQALRARHGLPDHMILFVGTLEPRKNLAHLIRAFAQAKRSAHLPHSLAIVGAPGWKQSGIERVIEQQGVTGDVIFAGYVPQAELPVWYRAAELLVYPSLFEGFGLPPLEAMASGIPVIASNSSSLPEVVGDGGILVPPTDQSILAEAIISGVGDHARRAALIERGLIQAAKFSWEKAARETVQVYRSVLESRGAPSSKLAKTRGQGKPLESSVNAST